MKKIKSIRRFNQNYRNFSFADLTERADVEFLELVLQMDDRGNTIEESKFMADGELEEKNSYTFDTNNKLTSHILLYAVDDVTEKRVLKRDEKGLCLSETKYYGDDSGESTNYEYDEKGNVTAIIKLDEEGDFVSREEIKYHENGSLAERSTYDKDKKLQSSLTFTEPVDGQVEENELDGSGNLVSKTVIKFNDKGKELFTVQTNPQGKLISSVHSTYDEKGNIIKKVFKDFYSKAVTYTYNDKDLLIIQELFDEGGMLLRKNMYEYDDEGNVIAEQTYEMDTTRGGRDKHFGTRYEYEYFA